MEKINDMKRYGLSEAFTVYSEGFKDLTVSRVISQQKGLYRLISEVSEINKKNPKPELIAEIAESL